MRVRVVTKNGGSKQNRGHALHLRDAAALPDPAVTAGRTHEGGTTVTITGRDLSGATSVRFGSTSAASFQVTSPTTITAISPATPRRARQRHGDHARRVGHPRRRLHLRPGAQAVLVDPGSGPLVPTPVTLVGAALTADAQVTFGGAPATVLSASPDGTELTVNTPAHAAGFVDVTVTTVGGSATLTNGYLFVGGTTLTAVTPSAGPVAGLVNVTLTGSGFTGETLVTFGNKPSLAVFPNLEGTELTALLPSHVGGARGRHGGHGGWLGHADRRVHLRRGPDVHLAHPGRRPRRRWDLGDPDRHELPGGHAGPLRRRTRHPRVGEPRWHLRDGHHPRARGRCRGRVGDDAGRHRDPARRLHLRGGADADRRLPERGSDHGWPDGDADRHELPGRDAGVVRRRRRHRSGRRLADRGDGRHAGARGRAGRTSPSPLRVARQRCRTATPTWSSRC